jgi:hypothetical protein
MHARTGKGLLNQWIFNRILNTSRIFLEEFQL